MIRYHARWVLPITAPPIRDATVAEEGGRIAYVGPRDEAPAGQDRELGDAILMPGLVNAHTHLELTAFRGLLPELPFREWVRTLQRAKESVMTRERFLDAARYGIVEGLRAGITTYADTCDSGVALEAMRELGVRGIMYQEVFGPSPDPALVGQAAQALRERLTSLEPLETDRQRLGVSPHAPYTVSDPLFALLARSRRPMAIHIAESEAESELVVQGRGPFAEALRTRGIPVAPRAASPIALLERLGVLAARPLLIHCVHVTANDIEAIARSGSTVAHCPASNAKLGHGVAPLLAMAAAGIAVGLGSDSMASNDRMHLLAEARAAALAQRAESRRPDALTARAALHLATLGGAAALGLADRVGSLQPGREADLAAFDASDLAGGADLDPESAAVFALGGEAARFVCVAGNVRVWDWRLLHEDARLAARVSDTAARLWAWRDESGVVAGAAS